MPWSTSGNRVGKDLIPDRPVFDLGAHRRHDPCRLDSKRHRRCPAHIPVSSPDNVIPIADARRLDRDQHLALTQSARIGHLERPNGATELFDPGYAQAFIDFLPQSPQAIGRPWRLASGYIVSRSMISTRIVASPVAVAEQLIGRPRRGRPGRGSGRGGRASRVSGSSVSSSERRSRSRSTGSDKLSPCLIQNRKAATLANMRRRVAFVLATLAVLAVLGSIGWAYGAVANPSPPQQLGNLECDNNDPSSVSDPVCVASFKYQRDPVGSALDRDLPNILLLIVVSLVLALVVVRLFRPSRSSSPGPLVAPGP